MVIVLFKIACTLNPTQTIGQEDGQVADCDDVGGGDGDIHYDDVDGDDEMLKHFS